MRWLLLIATIFTVSGVGQSTTTSVGQPIPFSHKQHASQAHLKCAECHKAGALRRSRFHPYR